MGLYYQTEYRLGRGGGRVCRTYTGLRAFLAIAIDLVFMFTFELVLGLLFFLARNLIWIVAGILLAVFYALSIPFRVARWVSLKLSRGEGTDAPAGGHLKPAWAGHDEV
jgi:hypothetical protein